jgi:phospholipid/cholesterol/gamma-HCH transport system permease protein
MSVLEAVGGGLIGQLAYIGGLTKQLCSSLGALPRLLPFVGRRGRWRSAIKQMAAIGVDALPMVAIVAACGGSILAIQSASELSHFGALRLVIDIVVIAFTRELGPLVTAIVVSGRSGSAFSAEIGTMVVTAEIDALRTMAIDPIELVLAPKYLAAMIVVPCLNIASNVFGILAGAVFMYLRLNMTLPMYLRYAAGAVHLSDLLVGQVKSLAFATIIVHVGCMEGFRVRGGPEAVGKAATSAVVKSTLLVIFADLFITAIFYMLGMGR